MKQQTAENTRTEREKEKERLKEARANPKKDIEEIPHCFHSLCITNISDQKTKSQRKHKSTEVKKRKREREKTNS